MNYIEIWFIRLSMLFYEGFKNPKYSKVQLGLYNVVYSITLNPLPFTPIYLIALLVSLFILKSTIYIRLVILTFALISMTYFSVVSFLLSNKRKSLAEVLLDVYFLGQNKKMHHLFRKGAFCFLMKFTLYMGMSSSAVYTLNKTLLASQFQGMSLILKVLTVGLLSFYFVKCLLKVKSNLRRCKRTTIVVGPFLLLLCTVILWQYDLDFMIYIMMMLITTISIILGFPRSVMDYYGKVMSLNQTQLHHWYDEYLDELGQGSMKKRKSAYLRRFKVNIRYNISEFWSLSTLQKASFILIASTVLAIIYQTLKLVLRLNLYQMIIYGVNQVNTNTLEYGPLPSIIGIALLVTLIYLCLRKTVEVRKNKFKMIEMLSFALMLTSMLLIIVVSFFNIPVKHFANALMLVCIVNVTGLSLIKKLRTRRG